MRTIGIIVVSTAAAALAVPISAQVGSQPAELEDAVLERCTVTVKKELSIPAEDPGVLKKIAVKEGDVVEENAPLCKIDDTEALTKLEIAESTRDRAQAEAENEINIKYSEKAAGVAKAELDAARSANERSGSNPTIPEAEVRRRRLDWERAGYQIEQAKMDKSLAALDAKARAAEVKGAEDGVMRRRFMAPFAGQIVEIFRREGEWVQPGDRILRLMQFDTMTVSGSIDATTHDPEDVDGKPVTLEVTRARGRKVALQGVVTYVSPNLQSDNKYRIEAEVTNRRGESGHWLVPHGAMATMTVHVK